MPPPDLTQPGVVLTLTPEYASAYNALARPSLRFTVSRYFAERWVPILGLYPQGAQARPRRSAGKTAGRTAWLVTAVRQLIYWNDHDATSGAHTVSRRLEFLAQESGLGRDQILDILAEPLCQWFVQTTTRGHYFDQARQHPVRLQNQYRVRMDEPLTPADAEHLADRLAACPVTASEPLARALERVRQALALPVAELRAPDVRVPLANPERFMSTQPLEVLDLVRLVEPKLPEPDPQQSGWVELAQACEQLAARVIAPDDVVGDTYYFRKQWVKRLGRGQAWALLLLRDRCYDSATEQREACWLPDYDWLARRVGVDNETIGDWLHGGLKSFVKVLEQKKGWDADDPQRVSYRVWVALRNPLTPEDQARYAGQVTARLSPEVSGESRLSTPEVTGESRLSAGGSSENPDYPAQGSSENHDYSAEGSPENHDYPAGGSSENPDRIKSPINLKSPLPIQKSQPNQTSPSTARPAFALVHAALEKLSVGDADDLDCDGLLKELGIQNPSRGRILKTQPSAEAILAWALFVASHTAVKQQCGLLVSKLLNAEEQAAAPAPFSELAKLSPAQWTAFALAGSRQAAGLAPPWGLSAAEREGFERWWRVYREVETEQLPYQLGIEATRLWAIENKGRSNGKTTMATGRNGTGKWQTDYG